MLNYPKSLSQPDDSSEGGNQQREPRDPHSRKSGSQPASEMPSFRRSTDPEAPQGKKNSLERREKTTFSRCLHNLPLFSPGSPFGFISTDFRCCGGLKWDRMVGDTQTKTLNSPPEVRSQRFQDSCCDEYGPDGPPGGSCVKGSPNGTSVGGPTNACCVLITKPELRTESFASARFRYEFADSQALCRLIDPVLALGVSGT